MLSAKGPSQYRTEAEFPSPQSLLRIAQSLLRLRRKKKVFIPYELLGWIRFGQNHYCSPACTPKRLFNQRITSTSSVSTPTNITPSAATVL